MHLKSKRSNHPKSKNLFLSFICLLIFTNGCKKEISTGEPNAQIDQLKNWYENNSTNFNQSSKIFAGLKPDFNHSYAAIHNGGYITELNFDSPNKLVFAPGNIDERAKEKLMANTVVKLLLFNSPDSKEVKGAYMVLITENGKLSNVHYKDYADFSGSLRFYNLDGSFQNGYDLKNGKITRTLSKPDKAGMDLINLNDNSAAKSIRGNAKPGDRLMLFNANGDCNLVSSNTYGYVCVSIENSPEIPTHCYLQQTGSDTYIACSDDSPGNDAVYTGTGNTTPQGGGNNNSNKELNTDSLKNKYPCADKLILQPIFTSTSMNEFVKPFLTAQKPTITYKTSNNLAWSNTATGGAFMLGNTIYDPNSRLQLSTIVTLNEKMLENSSPLLIASATIHETIHSYIYYNVSSAENNIKYNYVDNNNWMAALNGFYAIKDLPSNYSNHTLMLTDYFDKSIAVLQTWNNTQANPYSLKELVMAMMYGLDTVDPGTSQSFIDNIHSAFAAIKTKYSVTASELNTFNRANLNSNNKLSTTGCN